MISNFIQEKYNNLVNHARYAIEHVDCGLAREILREIDKNFSFNLQEVGPEIAKNIADLKIIMQIVSFLDISEEEAANIFKNHLLTFFSIDIPLEDRISARYSYQGYSYKNSARLTLKKAILENKEPLGNSAIGQWIQKFDSRFSPDSRTENDVMNFIISDAEAQRLSQNEKYILKNILHAYDSLIASEVVDAIDMAVMLKNSGEAGSRKNTSEEKLVSSYYQPPKEDAEKSQINILLPINDALKKYPKLGEQLITSTHIKLKSFPDPVRPSIKNWLSDYTLTYGYDNHTDLIRMEYLYRRENAQNLSTSEKEKLSAILKSFDENTPLTINTSTKQIIFDRPEIGQRPNMEKIPQSTNQNNSSTYGFSVSPSKTISPVPNSFSLVKNHNENLSSSHFILNNDQYETTATPHQDTKSDSIGFSSPQKLPYEKQFSAPQTMSQKPAPQTFQSQSQFQEAKMHVQPPQSERIAPKEPAFQARIQSQNYPMARNFGKEAQNRNIQSQTPEIPHFNSNINSQASTKLETASPQTQEIHRKPEPIRINPATRQNFSSLLNGNINGNDKNEDEEELPKNVVNLKR